MLGFIGGSGIYEALPLKNTRTESVSTPYGDPAAPLTVGELAGEAVAFLPRHGEHHQHSPTEVPYRANIHALKQLGVERILASNAVGSLREGLSPQTLVVPDQLFDRTRNRQYSFFEDGIVVHTPFADPFCSHLSDHLAASARETDADCHRGGTYVCIEGPHYSTRAESEFFREQGWDVVGMTAVPEAKLAREAELCYATVAGVTDYDAWKEGAEVTLETVSENAAANRETITATIERAIQEMPDARDCDCAHAVEGAIVTPSEEIPADVKARVDALVGEYL